MREKNCWIIPFNRIRTQTLTGSVLGRPPSTLHGNLSRSFCAHLLTKPTNRQMEMETLPPPPHKNLTKPCESNFKLYELKSCNNLNNSTLLGNFEVPSIFLLWESHFVRFYRAVRDVPGWLMFQHREVKRGTSRIKQENENKKACRTTNSLAERGVVICIKFPLLLLAG